MKTPLLLALSLTVYGAQAQIPGRSIKEYTTRMGTVIHVGDTLTFASGRRDDGYFRSASIPMLADKGALPASWNHRKVIVKDLREMPYKTGPVVSVVFKASIYNAKLDLDTAEENGEIITANNTIRAIPNTGSVADELLKLKSLLDAGALTQAEYDAQKAKLLAR